MKSNIEEDLIMQFMMPDSGVHVTPSELRANRNVELVYNGLLAESGAEEVYAHCGASYLADWTNIQDIKMNKNSNGSFSAHIRIPEGNAFHVCFHDNASNWDNNSGSNYSFRIEK